MENQTFESDHRKTHAIYIFELDYTNASADDRQTNVIFEYSSIYSIFIFFQNVFPQSK